MVEGGGGELLNPELSLELSKKAREKEAGKRRVRVRVHVCARARARRVLCYMKRFLAEQSGHLAGIRRACHN